MPLPLATLAPVALRYGALAATAAFALHRAWRAAQPAPYDQTAEDALDRAPEGVAARADAGQGNGSARFRRVIRFRGAAAFEVDLAALGRLKVRRI